MEQPYAWRDTCSGENNVLLESLKMLLRDNGVQPIFNHLLKTSYAASFFLNSTSLTSKTFEFLFMGNTTSLVDRFLKWVLTSNISF